MTSALRRRYGRSKAPHHIRYQARKIVDDLMVNSHRLTPYLVRVKWDVSKPAADRLYWIPTAAFGPGGRGYEWAIKYAESVLMGERSGYPTRRKGKR